MTTDFGMRDSYVAAMKGVILQRCPEVRIHDLSHEIAPGDILEGAFFLRSCIPHFPVDTVHLIVIDPGVGTNRRKLATRIKGQYFVLPDNGLLTLLLTEYKLECAWNIEDTALLNYPVSNTFHGRDVFAPVAAHLADGGDPADIGKVVDDIVLLPFPVVRKEDGQVIGKIIHVDRFGNSLSNIRRQDLPQNGQSITISIGSLVFDEIMTTYGLSGPGTPVVLFSSSGFLEVAVNRMNASHAFGIKKGDVLTVRISS